MAPGLDGAERARQKTPHGLGRERRRHHVPMGASATARSRESARCTAPCAADAEPAVHWRARFDQLRASFERRATANSDEAAAELASVGRQFGGGRREATAPSFIWRVF